MRPSPLRAHTGTLGRGSLAPFPSLEMILALSVRIFVRMELSAFLSPAWISGMSLDAFLHFLHSFYFAKCGPGTYAPYIINNLVILNIFVGIVVVVPGAITTHGENINHGGNMNNGGNMNYGGNMNNGGNMINSSNIYDSISLPYNNGPTKKGS
jgi:hypothetical protein